MNKKVVPPPRIEHLEELKHLYVQLSTVNTLIRALEEYRKFYPKLVERKRQSA